MNESSEHEAGPATPLPQHTPGPWHWDPEFGEVVAALSEVPVPPTTMTVVAENIVAESVTKANGLLIAAAPDLLAALRWLDNARQNRTGSAKIYAFMDTAVSAAIAKAEGRDAE